MISVSLRRVVEAYWLPAELWERWFHGMIFALIRLLRKVLRYPSIRRLVITALVAVAAVLINGALFYLAEVVVGPQHLSFYECLYWALVTMATVGYGDIVPQTTLGRIVAGETIVLGIAVFTVFVSTLAEEFMQSSIRRSLGLARLKNVDVVVVGYTEVCQETIEEIRRNMPRVRIAWVLETQPRYVPEDVDFVVGDPTDEETLRRAGIEKAKYLVVCLLDDSQALHVVLTARKLNKNLVISSIAKSSKTAELLKEAGVSIVVPFRLLGRELASSIFEPSVVHFLHEVTTIRGVADLVEYRVEASEDGKKVSDVVKTLTDSDKGTRYAALMIKRGDRLMFVPSEDTVLKAGDRLVLIKARKGEERERDQAR